MPSLSLPFSKRSTLHKMCCCLIERGNNNTLGCLLFPPSLPLAQQHIETTHRQIRNEGDVLPVGLETTHYATDGEGLASVEIVQHIGSAPGATSCPESSTHYARG